LTTKDMLIKAPQLITQATSGTLYEVYKYPDRLGRAMLVWLEGSGGILAMLRLQALGEPPMTAPGAAVKAHHELRVINKKYSFL
jgi:hypothetical protein